MLTTFWVNLPQNILFVVNYLLSLQPQTNIYKDMKQTLNTLKRIEHDAIETGKAIRNEGRVWQEELEERKRLGLQGDAAIKHYNEWMQRYGMEHLMVK
jgi:hypothetical protein